MSLEVNMMDGSQEQEHSAEQPFGAHSQLVEQARMETLSPTAAFTWSALSLSLMQRAVAEHRLQDHHAGGKKELGREPFEMKDRVRQEFDLAQEAFDIDDVYEADWGQVIAAQESAAETTVTQATTACHTSANTAAQAAMAWHKYQAHLQAAIAQDTAAETAVAQTVAAHVKAPQAMAAKEKVQLSGRRKTMDAISRYLGGRRSGLLLSKGYGY